MLKKRGPDEQMVAPTAWQPPEPATSELRHRFGDSVLLEFIRGHGPSAVLRELVQNEYDAGGSALHVIFGETALEVRGNGAPIDQKGWRRLSVTLGTGSVPGFKDDLMEKENGIGSKNFGLRSLFLFGDNIYVRSNGRQTLLDLRRGALEKPRPDPTTVGIRGVRIHVPYRTEPTGSLNAFTESVESAVFDDFATHISPSLLKLAHHGTRKGLRSVIVSSARESRQIVWRQRIKQLPSAERGSNLLVRRITRTDSKLEKREIMEELEWQKRFELPAEFRHERVPGYFRDRGARIKVGISLRTRRGKLSPSHPAGIAYYPIGVPQASTGNCVSISAPFEMDADRSELVHTSNSTFNQWLLGRAAEMTVSLLRTEWFDLFGADAYRAVGEIGRSALTPYADAVEAGLKSDPCWPSRDVSRRKGRKVRFTAAHELNTISHPSLDHFLEDDRYLHPALCKSAALRSIAGRYGVREFSLNSLIRLRCAGQSSDNLHSKCKADEANYCYTDFPEHWRDVSRQQRCTAALDENRDKLTKQHRLDLASSETTLAANLSLAAAKNLWFVPREVSDICPVPEEHRLHPELTESGTLRPLCRRFNVADWIKDVATRAETGRADEHERTSLYRYLVATSGRVPRRILAVVRNSPVLRDREGHWVPPKSITNPGTVGIRRFGPALHRPHRDYIKNKGLAKALGFKNKITGDDIVRFAEIVSRQPQMAEELEKALESAGNLLTTRTIDRLAQIEFIRSNDGILRSPPDLHLRTPKNEACIGPDGPYPAGNAKRLFIKLGCRMRPAEERIVEYLAALRQDDRPPGRPDILYPELVRALERESDSRIYEDEEILWTGNGYSAPADTVLGAKWNRVFLDTVPTINTTSAAMIRTYRELGVCEQPEQHHWEQLFVSLGERYRAEPSPLSRSRRNLVRSAYAHCHDIPSLPSDLPWLLDDSGHLHTKSDAMSGRLVIEDDVPLGTELRNIDSPVSFADSRDPKIRSLFRHQGVKLLTEVRRKTGDRIGRLRAAPGWFREDEYLRRLRNSDFGAALELMAGRDFSGNTLEPIQRMIERLSVLEKIVFVEDIYSDYRVRRTSVGVSANYAWTDDGIHLAWVRSRAMLEDMLASLIAEQCMPDGTAHAGFSDSVFRLVNCENGSDIQEYLERRGIRWRPKFEIGDEDDAHHIGDLERSFAPRYGRDTIRLNQLCSVPPITPIRMTLGRNRILI